MLYRPPDLRPLVAAQVERGRILERQTDRIMPALFPHLRGRHRGERIRNFRKAWATAGRKAGVPWMFRHDMRWSAVRTMVNAGAPERVAMSVTGHKTRGPSSTATTFVRPGDLRT